ncbi:MAG: hypothetical protein IJU18_06220 [Oscillospiraceae bacterium]|nr:hypothetical protein [Oscillospiraceae bacterium]
MVKGVSRRVIVVDSPDPQVFEQAIFILRNGTAGEGVTSQQLVDQAVQVARSYTRYHMPRRRRRLTPVWTALGGAAVIGLVWLLVALL